MKNKISTKLFKMLIIIAVMIILLAATTVSIQYWFSMKEMYQQELKVLTEGAASFIDGDKVLQYLETGEPDDYYEEVQVYLNTIAKSDYVMYYYVILPTEDEIIYIWDGLSGNEQSYLGDSETYSDDYDEKEHLMAAMNGSKPGEIYFVNGDYGLLATASYPIYNSEGQSVALAAADLSMPNMINDLVAFTLAVALSSIVVIIFSLGIYYLFIKKRIITPLAILNQGASQMVSKLESKEENKISISSGDEFQQVAESFNEMDREVRQYIEEVSRINAEKERIGAELKVGTQIQADMLPSIFPKFENREDLMLNATMDPAKEVGGDFYDFFFVDDDHLGLVCADVSGKGVPAALFMVIAKTLIKNYAMMGQSPSQILYNTNNTLCEGNNAGLFVTVWLAILDLNTGKGIAANAGHEHPALMRKDGSYELVKYRHSMAVATMEDLQFKEHEFELFPGDKLFIYTDGVTEATDANNELFGDSRLIDALNKNKDATPHDLLSLVASEINAFVKEAPQFDDITMLSLEYLGR